MIRNDKAELRKAYTDARKAMPAETKSELERKITQRFLKTLGYQYASGLLIYMSTAGEIDTAAIIRQAIADGKNVALPRCTEQRGVMRFHRVGSIAADDMILNRFGLLEPNPETCPIADAAEYGLCVVPALAFDAEGYRLGYGGGYYDRFLAEYGGIAVGLAFSGNVVKALPRGRYDKNVDLIVTEKGIRRTK